MKHLLPCSSCGEAIPVDASQAGQSVTCQCGQQLEIPTMRAIRQLPPLREATAPPRRPTSGWSTAQRLVFALGLAVAVPSFLLAGYFQWGRTYLNTEEIPWDQRLETDLDMLENMNLEEAWENWKKVRDTDIGPYRPPHFIRARMISQWWKDIVLVSLGVGGAGVLLMGIAFLLPRPHRGPPRKRASATRPRGDA